MIKLQQSILIIVGLLFSFLWSLCLFQYWSSDFGFYYLTSNSLTETNNLYTDMFDHKGPVYYIFIRFFTPIIGYGLYQSYFVLSITVFLFVLTLLSISKNKNFTYSVILFLLIFSLLHTQNVNISIQLFQSSLVILSFYFLFSFLNDEKVYKIHFSYLFLILAIFTRIDSLIYLPVLILSSIIIYKNNFFKIFIINTFLIIYFLVIYISLSFFLNFTLDDYLITNIKFNFTNSWAAFREPFIRMFNSPAHIYFLLFTGIFYLFIEVTNSVIKKKSLKIKTIYTRDNLDILISLLILFIGTFFWLYTGSDKNYHVFILITPLIFLITNYYNFLSLSKIKIYFFILLGSFFTLITIYPEQKNVIVSNCVFDYKNCSNISNMHKTIMSIDKINNPIFIGGNSWLFVINKKTIDYSINNYPFYVTQIRKDKLYDIFYREHYFETHNFLLNQPQGYQYWIKKNIYNLDATNIYLRKSSYLRELLEKSSILEDQGDYYKLKIIK